MNIYIKVEIKNRDLLSRLLLGCYAALKNNDVYIGDDELFEYVQKKKFNPGIIFEKSITPKKERIDQLKNYKKNNCIITSLDEEGGYAALNYRDFATWRYSRKSLKLTDKAMCWGNFDYKINVNLFKKYKKKFVITGNPRFDILKDRYSSLLTYDNKKRDNSKNNKVIILSSFGVHVTKLNLAETVSIRRNFGMFSKKDSENKYFEWIDYKSNIFFQFIKLINNISERFPKLNLEIWMHPKERLELWNKFLKKKKKITFIKKTNFKNVNINKTLFIHNSSGSGIEAVAGKNITYSFLPFKSKYDDLLPNIASNKVKSIKQMCTIIDNYFYKKKDIKRKNNYKILKKYIVNCSEKVSYLMILDEWLKFKSSSLEKKNDLKIVKLRNNIRFLRRKVDKRIYNYKFPEISKIEFEKIQNRLLNIEPMFKKLNFNLIGPKLIFIRKK